jgi:hypothetical protein
MNDMQPEFVELASGPLPEAVRLVLKGLDRSYVSENA